MFCSHKDDRPISDPKTLPAGLTPLNSLPFNCDKWIHRSKTTKPVIINCCFNRKNAPCGTGTSVAYEVSCNRNLGLNKVQESSYQVCHDRSNDNTLYSRSIRCNITQNWRHFQIMWWGSRLKKPLWLGAGDPNSSSTPGIPNRNHSSTILTRK